jgi:hypothetical protein
MAGIVSWLTEVRVFARKLPKSLSCIELTTLRRMFRRQSEEFIPPRNLN